ncbi:MAG: phosphatidate cytidylyltransferase [Bacteroidales bacterium]|nr:phosphatidate cytidylyltransferase [Bacteroidales bacterium]
MKNLLTRGLTGIFFVAIIIATLLNLYSTLSLFLIISFLGVYEFYTLLKKAGNTPYFIAGLIISIVLFICTSIPNYIPVPFQLYLVIIPLFILFGLKLLFSEREHPITNISITIFPIIYVVLPTALFVRIPLLLGSAYSHQILWGFFILLWSYDTFAYLTGISLGRHKLFERISPKKTWEGLIGGVLFSLISAWLVSKWLQQIGLVHWLVISLIISIIGTLGDLTASMMKRSLNTKDSGTIFPGHGGIIDRFDSFLFAAPSVYLYLAILS